MTCSGCSARMRDEPRVRRVGQVDSLFISLLCVPKWRLISDADPATQASLAGAVYSGGLVQLSSPVKAGVALAGLRNFLLSSRYGRAFARTHRAGTRTHLRARLAAGSRFQPRHDNAPESDW
jgi:hypothetical protein